MMLLSRKTVSAFLSFLVFTAATTTNGSEISAEDQAFPLADTTRAAQSNIVGGGDVPKDKYPWFAEALKRDGSWHGCGGSLVTPEYVLTAAYCVINTPDLAKFQIGALSDDATNGGQTSQIIQVEKVYSHEGFNPATNDKDFALIKLVQRVNNINPVKMDPGSLSPSYSDGKYFWDNEPSIDSISLCQFSC